MESRVRRRRSADTVPSGLTAREGCAVKDAERTGPTGGMRSGDAGEPADEGVMRAHVFAVKPHYCVAFKPALIWVRCPECGHPHQEYLGPQDLDERRAELEFFRQECERLEAMMLGTKTAP